MTLQPPTNADLDAVTAQLGRRPRGVIAIAARCPAGHPSVIASGGLQRHGDRLVPFPTLYWLTCRQLVRAVSRLEMRGLIAELEQELAADPELLRQLAEDHRDYARSRWELLAPEDREAARAAGLTDDLQQRGIGGLVKWNTVKCLHLHVAHHLAAHNALGALVCARFGVQPCTGEPAGG
ncbi:MAG: DUF501 domain-containing protein [Planctomycetes bacterium]|nr:DUF501 domain-containing protein [Planctomycetota bacterium]MCB9870074.1 DUF501 domain-containing protein [Planctomycetota bacterium]MCB9889509.1 DUF501 domain-containing protein [Planctomycetota bacterium]